MSAERRETFELYLIKPSHYDNDGYVIQWLRSSIPSNALAVLNALASDCTERQVLGDHVDINITVLDETNTRIRPARIAQAIKAAGGRGMVGFVGVQSNQFYRALDIARPLREADIPVCIGGFHVSGCIAMLDELTPELKDAQAMGIALFAGEAEDGRLDQVLKDAHAGALQPLYNHMNDLPSLENAPFPILPAAVTRLTAANHGSFDAGRGCPFQCSFCTIINVQGRKSRFRNADDVEKILRANLERGVFRLFITDDNFARNKNWEAIFDRLIKLREEDGLKAHLIIQVDTMCHKMEGFIEKAAAAGVRRVFIGLENINPDNLVEANKRQNKITEYRKMLLEWKAVRVVTYAGYIIGFPADTPESVRRDIDIIKRELPVDLLEFFYLTPLPGSADHRDMLLGQTWMDEDLNHYDLNHPTTRHPNMSEAQWRDTYRHVWDQYYSDEHVETILRRAYASSISPGKLMFLMVWFYGGLTQEGLHPLEVGYIRRKYRRDRRPGLSLEMPGLFHLKWLYGLIASHLRIAELYWKWGRIRARIKADPDARNYTDTAMTPPSDDDLETLDMFNKTDGGEGAVKRARKR